MAAPNGILSISPPYTPGTDDFTHELVAHDIAEFHAGHEAVEEMQVRAAYRARRDLDDRVARMFDHRVRHGFMANVLLALPYERFHDLHPWNVSGHA
ncbi:hypothetical protein AWB78_05804 [Caballeronia calidae]|uniref:Uncharacterized protein n=1 Tax=Caballeronia calidae TaxID=1777139 RepID=A0A158DY85_9BURK|nr:hypothetical protein AWB78_05804 [Caballeronia calidae]